MTIDAATRLYCIIGNPVSHSMSPAIHNAAFADKGINAAYVAFRVEDVEGAIEGIRALGIHGASVTIPHKVTIIPLLDRVDEVAKMIGAVWLIVKEQLIPFNGISSKIRSISASVSMATPLRPTSPSARGSSESMPSWVGMSKAMLRPVCP